MKKFILSVLFFWVSIGFAYCATDWEGNTYTNTAMWRSSVTASADTFVTITTQAVSFHGVIVSSPGVGSPTFCAFDANNNPIMSTVVASSLGSYFSDVQVGTTSLKYINGGSTPANVTILWQYRTKHDPGK